MITRRMREQQLLRKAETETGREDLIRTYRKALRGGDPMAIAVYPEIIEAILNVEFPPMNVGSS